MSEIEVPKVKARWDGPDVVKTPDHGTLVPGETIVEIGAHEAVQSEHWTPLDPVHLPDPVGDEIAAKVAELVDSNSREQLDGLAEPLGLNPADYANKTDIATAIVTAQGS